MCQGAVTYTAPENGRGNVVRNRRPSINWDAVEAQQVADEEKYGIRRSNPLENDEKYFKRVGEYRQAENDKIERERRAVTAQQMTRRAELEAAAAAAEALRRPASSQSRCALSIGTTSTFVFSLAFGSCSFDIGTQIL